MESLFCKECGKPASEVKFRAKRRVCCACLYKRNSLKRNPDQTPINNLPNEVWKDVIGYEDKYQVSNLGRVKSLIRGVGVEYGPSVRRFEKLLRQSITRGYLAVQLNKEGRGKTRNVHRLVAESFIPNPENNPQVNHKDGNKLNNHLDNLEWVTRSENMKHAYRIGLTTSPMKGRTGILAPAARSVVQLDLKGNFLEEFDCMKDAEAASGVKWQNISSVVRGINKQAGGFKWLYKENYKT